MRFDSEKNKRKNGEGRKSYEITKKLLEKFPKKKWVIDAGSLQVMEKDWIPKKAILTPNKKEYEILFGKTEPQEAARKYDCIVVRKGSTAQTCSPKECIEVNNGNTGLAKGGTGDVLAGLTVSLLAKNDPFLAASSASYISKLAADELYRGVGTNYNADDLAEKIPQILAKFI